MATPYGSQALQDILGSKRIFRQWLAWVVSIDTLWQILLHPFRQPPWVAPSSNFDSQL